MLKFVDWWPWLRVRIKTSEEKVLHFFRALFVGLIELFKEWFKIGLRCLRFAIEGIYFLLAHGPKGWSLKQDVQYSYSHAVYICRSSFIKSFAVDFRWPIAKCSSNMLYTRTEFLWVTQVNQCELIVFCEHQIIWLDVQMSHLVVGVEIEYILTQLFDKISLNFHWELKRFSNSPVQVPLHQ